MIKNNLIQNENYEHSLDILARTIYGEARGEYKKLNGGLSSLIAIGNIVVNRTYYPYRFGKTISEVCLKPYQFSCWNVKDPNYQILKSNLILKNEIFNLCQEVAEMVMRDKCPDLTQQSDHYYAVWLKPPPVWTTGFKPKIQIGQHLFFKIIS